MILTELKTDENVSRVSAMHSQMVTPTSLFNLYMENNGKMQKILLHSRDHLYRVRLYFTMTNYPYYSGDIDFCAKIDNLCEFIETLDLLYKHGDISKGAYELAKFHVRCWPNNNPNCIEIEPYFGVQEVTFERGQKVNIDYNNIYYDYTTASYFRGGKIAVQLMNSVFGKQVPKMHNDIRDVIKKVQINEKKKVVTIVWTDGQVTLAKCGSNDIWDPEKGLLVCIAKHFWVSGTQFNKWLKAQIPEQEPEQLTENAKTDNPYEEFSNDMSSFLENSKNDTYVPKHAAK